MGRGRRQNRPKETTMAKTHDDRLREWLEKKKAAEEAKKQEEKK